MVEFWVGIRGDLTAEQITTLEGAGILPWMTFGRSLEAMALRLNGRRYARAYAYQRPMSGGKGGGSAGSRLRR